MTNYSVLNGLPSQTVYNTIEDRNGFLWIATDAGVSRFDGHKFINYTTDDNLGANEILELYEDSKGRIWFLPFFGGLSYYLNGTFYNNNNSNLIQNLKTGNTLRHMVEDKDGYLYIQSSISPFELAVVNAQDSIIYLNLKHLGIEPLNLYRIFLNEEHKITILTDVNKFYTFENGKILLDTLLSNNLKRSKIFISFDHHEAFYLDQQGIKISSNKKINTILPIQKIRNPEMLLTINKDQFGNLWLSYSDNRTIVYFKYNKDYEEGVPIISNIQSNNCFGKSPIAWLCSSTHGLIKIPLSSFQKDNFYINSNILSENVNSLFCQKNGTIWAGYTDGFVSKFSNQSITHFNLNLGTRNYNRILEISEDKNSTPYFITDEAACRIRKEHKIEYYTDTNIPSAGKGLFQSPDGFVYFSRSATMNGFSDQNPEKYTKRIININSRRFSHCIDKENNIYISTSEGVIYINHDTIINLSKRSTEMNCRVNKFLVLDNNDIVLATYGSGIIILRDQKILQIIAKAEGLPGIVCRYPYLYQDSLFVATHSGIALIVPDRDKYKFIYNYTISDGLISDNVNCIFVKDYKLYASSSKGISVVDLKNTNSINTNKYCTNIQSIMINGKEFKSYENISLRYSNYHIQVHFVTPNLSGDNSLIHRYKLLPQDVNWNSTYSDVLDFSNLEPDTYKVIVQSKYNKSSWSSPIEINFTILKPFYSTWYFRTIVFSFLLFGIFQIFKYYSKKKYELALLDARMKEAVHRERDRIASDIHDDLGADLTNILILTQLLKSQKNESKDKSISKLENRINEIINKMNEVIWALNHSNDKLYSLAAYIRSYVQTITEQTKLEILLNIDPSININAPVSALVRRNIFLTIKEFINNSIKHSEATSMKINIFYKESILYAELSDNGRGMESKENFHLGNGILNMKKRINGLNGSIHFLSNIPNGLKLIFRVPIK